MSRWDFDVKRSGMVENWRWRRTEWDLTSQSSDGSFPSFSECFDDAAMHGCSSQAVVVINTCPGEAHSRPQG